MSRPAFFLTIVVISLVTAVLAGPYEQVAAPAPPPPSYGPADTLTVTITEEIARIEQEASDAYFAALAEEQARQEAEQKAVASVSVAAATPSVGTGDCASIPGWFPTAIAYRESHCNYDAYNPGGCGGYGCIGAFQFDARHFTGWANGQSACGDLDAWTVEGQNECAWRLSRGGTNFAPWGG